MFMASQIAASYKNPYALMAIPHPSFNGVKKVIDEYSSLLQIALLIIDHIKVFTYI